MTPTWLLWTLVLGAFGIVAAIAIASRCAARREAYRAALLDAIRNQQPNGSGFTLETEVCDRLGWWTSFGRLYVELDRLERQGIISSRWGEATAARGWRRPRLYWITADFPDLKHDGVRR